MKKSCFKKLQILLMLVITSIFSVEAQTSVSHLVRPGETLYTLAHQYGVTVEDIRSANPGMSVLTTGSSIIIPCSASAKAKKTTNVVKTTEAVKTVSTTKEEAAKFIATQAEPQSVLTVDETNVALSSAIVGEIDPSIYKKSSVPMNIAVILPFNLTPRVSEDLKIQSRCVEFYEGFLMAVDELQKAGNTVYLQVYDLETQSLTDILTTPVLTQADLIIGPMEASDVKRVAYFAETHKINMVAPFTFDLDLAKLYKHLFQLNTSKTMLYEELTNDLTRRFAQSTIVFLSDSLETGKHEDYVSYLQKALDSNNIDYYEFAYANPADIGVVDSVFNLKGDVLFVPYTSGKEALRRMFPYLNYIQNNSDSIEISVLGYPEWQLYSQDFMNYYYDLNLYMFTKIYVNPFDEKVKRFYEAFKTWYGKDPMPIYPKYALLGYDVGAFFLSSLSKFGPSFERYIENQTVETLQTVMHFESVDNGDGYINRSIYLVHFTPETTIEKHVIK